MTIYMGGDGAIELKRKATHDITELLQPSDVHVAARSFSVGLRIEQSLFTGDRIEIRTTDGSPLELVDGVTSDGWGGYIHVDAVGGVRLYSKYQNALQGGYDWALDLVAPTKAQELIFHTQDASYRFLAGISKFTFTTERSTVDTTQLGDEFRGQFDAGLISGQGSIDTQWIAPSMCDEYCDDSEFPRYLAQLCIRLIQGADFFGRFYVHRSPEKGGDSVWYEAECIVTNSSVAVEPGDIIRSSIQFVTTGRIQLDFGVPRYRLMLEPSQGGAVLTELADTIMLRGLQ
jgi:hypothetical protein